MAVLFLAFFFFKATSMLISTVSTRVDTPTNSEFGFPFPGPPASSPALVAVYFPDVGLVIKSGVR